MATKTKVGIGLGAAAMVAAAGAYLLTGERGKKNRAKVKEWSVKARQEVLREVVKVKKLTEMQYNQIVDTVMRQYEAIDKKEAAALVKELKSHWDNIRAELKGVQKTAKKASGRVVKKKSKSGK